MFACGALLRFEEAVLEPELLEAILANLSPEPEAKALRALKGVVPSELSPPERFCYQLARMPRLRPMPPRRPMPPPRPLRSPPPPPRRGR